MDEKPRLVEAASTFRRTANVLVVFGFAWYTSEAQVREYLQPLHQHVSPVTTRLYTNPSNGASRGICFVEYDVKHRDGVMRSELKTEQQDEADDIIARMKERIEGTPFERRYLTVVPYHLTNQNWDRGGRLPDLPTDPKPLPLALTPTAMRGGVVEGYGDEGFIVRCGAVLGLANTVTPSGIANMQALRKRLRMEEAELVAKAGEKERRV